MVPCMIVFGKIIGFILFSGVPVVDDELALGVLVLDPIESHNINGAGVLLLGTVVDNTSGCGVAIPIGVGSCGYPIFLRMVWMCAPFWPLLNRSPNLASIAKTKTFSLCWW